jgi:hypothetical protein
MVWPQNHSDGFSSVWVSKPMATICELFDLKTTLTVFIGLISKSVVTVSSGLTLKLAATVYSDLSSKLAATVSSGLALKPAVTMVFSSLASKLVVIVSPGLISKSADGFLIEPQNQGGGGFPDLGLKTGSFGLVI